MSQQLALVLLLLASAVVMFAVNRPRMDVVALLMIVLLPFTGVLTINEALAGFADANIVLIAALFVIGEGLVRTGVARALGDWLTKKAGSSEVRLVALLMVVVCTLGATMSSTAVTAIFIPVALRIAQATGSSPGRLMMPISVAALVSGMTTLIATAPNLVVNAELTRHLTAIGAADTTGFRFFTFLPFGAPILAIAVGYMLFARRLLPAGSGDAKGGAAKRPRLADWIDRYGLAQRESRLRIPANSSLEGRSVAELERGGARDLNVLAIERTARGGRNVLCASPDLELRAGDILLVDRGHDAGSVTKLRSSFGLEELPLSGEYFRDRSQELGMAEVMVTADSDLVGHTVPEAKFRTRSGLTVIGLRRRGASLCEKIVTEPLRIGDTLLVIGPWKAIARVRPADTGVVTLEVPSEIDEVLPVAGKAVQAVACLLLVVGLMIFGVVPNVHAALIGCILMGALGVIDLKGAYRAIDWKTLVLIVGMLPFSMALQRTGGVELMADGLMRAVGGAGNHVILAAIFLITAVLGLFISNTATAVLMAPVAIAIAGDLHLSPYPFAMIVALAASTAFMTPVSSPVNTLVVTPGNYKFGDFVKLGVPLAILVMIFCVLVVPIVLPFAP
ncbi:MAG: SLC13 family permease [Phycisphaerales bacterium]